MPDLTRAQHKKTLLKIIQDRLFISKFYTGLYNNIGFPAIPMKDADLIKSYIETYNQQQGTDITNEEIDHLLLLI